MTMITRGEGGQIMLSSPGPFQKTVRICGLRVGYITGQPDMIKNYPAIRKAPGRSPLLPCRRRWSATDKEYMQAALKKTIASKNYLYEVLKKRRVFLYPSSANFVLFPSKWMGGILPTR